jgi:uncharacterized glyoxalase superfamily protein PhnB
MTGIKTMKVATYLEFENNAEEVIETYQEIFDAEVVNKYYYDGDMTQEQGFIGKIFHAELTIGDLNLYICDSGKSSSFASIKFVVEIHEETEARKLFGKLAQNGRVISEFKKMPYGPTIAHVEDKFSIRWDVVIC